jgi:putative DNA primase/helicase
MSDATPAPTKYVPPHHCRTCLGFFAAAEGQCPTCGPPPEKAADNGQGDGRNENYVPPPEPNGGRVVSDAARAIAESLPDIRCRRCDKFYAATNDYCPTCGRTEPAPELFGEKGGLQAKATAEEVLRSGSICSGLGARLWYYEKGVYLPGGEAEVHRRTKGLLGNRWRRLHADTVVAWLAAEKPFIGDEQPTDIINTRTGLLDWRRGNIRAHTRDIPTTFQVPHVWDPSASCPVVDKWMAEVLPEDAIGFVWELLGYLLYPDNPLHIAVLLLGTGRNGKGTFLRLARDLLGPAHVSAVTLQALGENRFAAADLFGKVANLAGDLDARSIARTDLFKMATGGDPIHAERKYGQPFTFTNRATFVFAANELPGTADVSEGYFSRWQVVPFIGHFPPGKADPRIEDRLHAELPGVLARAVMGLTTLMARGGFDPPESVIEATADYRRRADPVRLFLAERIEVDAGANESRTTVHTAYSNWAVTNGYRPLAAGRFYDRFMRACPTCGEKVINGVRMLAGVRLYSGS